MKLSSQTIQDRRVRALSGPLTGLSFPVNDFVKIGRASDSDIRLVDKGVSRRHARIRRFSNGRDHLEDLMSTNGTMVDGLRIRRQILSAGMHFTIGNTRFVYEHLQATGPGAAPRGFRVPLVMGLRSRNVTAMKPAGRPTDHPSAAEAEPDDVTETNPQGIPGADPPAETRPAPPYAGDLVGDIVSYRSVRAMIGRGEALGRGCEARLRAIESRLWDTNSEQSRGSLRFDCRFPAELRLVGDEACMAVLTELGVGGARLAIPDGRRVRAEKACLAIHLVREYRAVTVMLSAKVAWSQRGHVGLEFDPRYPGSNVTDIA